MNVLKTSIVRCYKHQKNVSTPCQKKLSTMLFWKALILQQSHNNNIYHVHFISYHKQHQKKYFQKTHSYSYIIWYHTIHLLYLTYIHTQMLINTRISLEIPFALLLSRDNRILLSLDNRLSPFIVAWKFLYYFHFCCMYFDCILIILSYKEKWKWLSGPF